MPPLPVQQNHKPLLLQRHFCVPLGIFLPLLGQMEIHLNCRLLELSARHKTQNNPDFFLPKIFVEMTLEFFLFQWSSRPIFRQLNALVKYAAAVCSLFAGDSLVPASWRFVAVSSAPRGDLGFAVSKQQQVCLKREAQVKT